MSATPTSSETSETAEKPETTEASQGAEGSETAGKSEESETSPPSQTTEAHQQAHPTPQLYVQIAAALAVLTAMEVSTYFVDFGPLAIPLLVVLMAIKFAMVAGFFMHLKFDTRIFARLMGGGLVLALTIYLVVLLTFTTVTPVD